MDRNTTIGLVLISIILIGYFFYNANKAQQALEQSAGKEQTNTTSSARDNNAAFEVPDNGLEEAEPDTSLTPELQDSVRNIKLKSKFGAFASAATGEGQEYTLENEDVKIIFSSKGGEMVSAELKKYKTYDQKPLILFNEGDNRKSLNFPTLSSNVFTSDLFFETAGVQQTDSGSTIQFALPAEGGGKLIQSYSLPNKGYLLDYDLSLNGLNNVIPANASYLNLVWSRKLAGQEKDKTFEDRYTALYYKYHDDDVDNLDVSGASEEAPAGKIDWISYKQQFFNTTLLSKGDLLFENVKVKSAPMDDVTYLKDFSSTLILPYKHTASQQYAMQYYIGPNHYQTLKKMGNEMEDIIDLGSGIMSFVSVISKWIIIPVFNFLERYISNYGWIILILTLMIKIAILPLSYKSYLSAAKMRVIKPEMDELKEKYKDDQSKFAQEQMKLYSKAGVNPLGGCIPQLIPFPILLAMYYFFPASIELRQESFLWASDLSTYDSIFTLPFEIPFYGDHVSLFTLLMAVTSVIYTLTNAQMTGAAEGPMKYMPYFIPIMLLAVFNSFPAALSYYYLLQNLTSMGQQALIKQFFIDEDKLHKQIQENKKKKPKDGGGGFADRLKKAMEEQNKRQQDAARKKNKK